MMWVQTPEQELFTTTFIYLPGECLSVSTPLAQQILIKLHMLKKKKQKPGLAPVEIHIKPEPPRFKRENKN